MSSDERSTLQLPAVERLQAARVAPGDVVIATVPAGTRAEAANRIAEMLRDRFPNNRVLIVSAGVEIAFAGPEQQEGAWNASGL